MSMIGVVTLVPKDENVSPRDALLCDDGAKAVTQGVTMVDEKTAEEALKAGNFEEIKRLLEQDKVGALAAFDGAGGTRRILDWRDNNDLATNADRRKSIAFLIEQGLTNLDGLAFALTLHHATYDAEEGLRLYSSIRPRFPEADEAKIAQFFCEHPDESRELLDAGEVLAVEDADLWVLAHDTVSLLRPSGASRVGSVSELIGQAISD